MTRKSCILNAWTDKDPNFPLDAEEEAHIQSILETESATAQKAGDTRGLDKAENALRYAVPYVN